MSSSVPKATLLRGITFSLILFSIITTYYVMVIDQNYTILTNPEGPETEEYFEELNAT